MGNIIVSALHVLDEERNMIICQEAPEKVYGDINTKIEIYRARVLGWFLNIAKDLVANGVSAGDYIAVMVALSHIEGLEQFREGKETPRSSSGKWFKKGASRIFPEQTEDVLERLWKETRCGLFHAGFPNGKIYLSHDRESAIEADGEKIFINPKGFVNKVTCNFICYIEELRDVKNTNLRSNFEKLWDIIWDKT
jgi:hypothetical protein